MSAYSLLLRKAEEKQPLRRNSLTPATNDAIPSTALNARALVTDSDRITIAVSAINEAPKTTPKRPKYNSLDRQPFPKLRNTKINHATIIAVNAGRRIAITAIG
jgi:hypothetical protein